jgi:hypothetical protein
VAQVAANIVNVECRTSCKKSEQIPGPSALQKIVGSDATGLHPPDSQVSEAHEVVRRRASHIFWTLSSRMAERLSALRAGRDLPPRKIPGTHFF